MQSFKANLMERIEKDIDEAIQKFINVIVLQYTEVDKEVLNSLWVDTREVETFGSYQEAENSPRTKPVNTDTRLTSDNGWEICGYRYIKGDKKGETCMTKSKSGGFCAIHKKYENVQPKEKKIMPTPKTASDINPSNSSASMASLNPHRKSGKAPVTLLLKSGVPYHQETGLAFKSSGDRVVTGKFVNDKIIPLTDADIETCKKWGFAYDNNNSSMSVDGSVKPTQSAQQPPAQPPLKSVLKPSSSSLTNGSKPTGLQPKQSITISEPVKAVEITGEDTSDIEADDSSNSSSDNESEDEDRKTKNISVPTTTSTPAKVGKNNITGNSGSSNTVFDKPTKIIKPTKAPENNIPPNLPTKTTKNIPPLTPAPKPAEKSSTKTPTKPAPKVTQTNMEVESDDDNDSENDNNTATNTDKLENCARKALGLDDEDMVSELAGGDEEVDD